jgi:hypothetical protein
VSGYDALTVVVVHDGVVPDSHDAVIAPQPRVRLRSSVVRREQVIVRPQGLKAKLLAREPLRPYVRVAPLSACATSAPAR